MSTPAIPRRNRGLIRLAGVLLLWALWGIARGAVTLTTPASIAGGDHSYDGTDLVVDATTLTIDGHHNFTSLTLQNGAVLTHSAATASPLQLQAGTVMVDASSRIDVSARGQALVSGVGDRSGASYGGSGGVSSGGTTNPTYGDARSPVDLGSGTYNSGTTTIRGGGALKLVADRLELAGQILANGQSSGLSYRGGGSGGSLWLQVGVLTGGGVIRADGGAGRNDGYYSASGGGGGRIALYYDTLEGFDPSAQSSAYGGLGYSGYATGAAGTIYLKSAAQSVAELRIDNGNRPATSATTGLEGVIPEPIYLNNAGLTLGAGSTVARIVGTNTSFVSASGALAAVGAGVDLEGVSLQANGALDWSGVDLRLQGSTLQVQGAQSFASLSLLDGAVLTHPAGSAAGLQVQAGTVMVDASSRIDVSARGQAQVSGVGDRSGASYGGLGGVPSGGTTNPTYGDARSPVDLGSGTYNNGTTAIRGGGALKLVADRLELAGQILANGQSSGADYRGGGSGGSLWLQVGVLTGGGVIRADGGAGRNNGYYSGGGGGGGRIALYYDSLDGFDPSAQSSAYGGLGYAGYAAGAAGTVYLQDRAAGGSRVRIDNADRAQTATTQVADLVTDVLVLSNARTLLTGVSAIGRVEATNAWLGATGTLGASSDQVVLSGSLVVEPSTPLQWPGVSVSLLDGAVLTQPVGSATGLQLQAGTVMVDAAHAST